jgi:ATP-dependent DNA ligase
MAPSSLPTVDLMDPTQIGKPFPHDGWVYEEKVDGWRMLAYKAPDLVRLVSRNGRDLARRRAGGAPGPLTTRRQREKRRST